MDSDPRHPGVIHWDDEPSPRQTFTEGHVIRLGPNRMRVTKVRKADERGVIKMDLETLAETEETSNV